MICSPSCTSQLCFKLRAKLSLHTLSSTQGKKVPHENRSRCYIKKVFNHFPTKHTGISSGKCWCLTVETSHFIKLALSIAEASKLHANCLFVLADYYSEEKLIWYEASLRHFHRYTSSLPYYKSRSPGSLMARHWRPEVINNSSFWKFLIWMSLSCQKVEQGKENIRER